MNEDDALLEAFVKATTSSQEIWGLKGDDGWAMTPSIEYEETDVFPFFQDKPSAAALCTGEWAAYAPAAIPLEEFLLDWLPGIHEDNAMVGIQWNADLDGPEVEPAELAAALDRVSPA